MSKTARLATTVEFLRDPHEIDVMVRVLHILGALWVALQVLGFLGDVHGMPGSNSSDSSRPMLDVEFLPTRNQNPNHGFDNTQEAGPGSPMIDESQASDSSSSSSSSNSSSAKSDGDDDYVCFTWLADAFDAQDDSDDDAQARQGGTAVRGNFLGNNALPQRPRMVRVNGGLGVCFGGGVVGSSYVLSLTSITC
jgi:hypothetical protein